MNRLGGQPGSDHALGGSEQLKRNTRSGLPTCCLKRLSSTCSFSASFSGGGGGGVLQACQHIFAAAGLAGSDAGGQGENVQGQGEPVEER